MNIHDIGFNAEIKHADVKDKIAFLSPKMNLKLGRLKYLTVRKFGRKLLTVYFYRTSAIVRVFSSNIYDSQNYTLSRIELHDLLFAENTLNAVIKTLTDRCVNFIKANRKRTKVPLQTLQEIISELSNPR